MQHDVLAFTYLQHTIEALQHAVDKCLFLAAQRRLCLDHDCLALEKRLNLVQAISSRGDQVADEICSAQLRGNFDRTREVNGLGVNILSLKVIPKNTNVTRCYFRVF